MFSVIVPVHNAENYIDSCIRSIVMQTFLDFELILVVNASSDDSYKICKEWELIDNRIRVILTDIAGVSHARNLGLDSSTKEWIVFVDADDYLLKDALQLMNQKIDENTDLFIANYTQNETVSKLSDKEEEIDAKDCLLALLDTPKYFEVVCKNLTYQADILGVNWAKAFRRNIIQKNNLRFNESITIFEDFLFNYDYISNIRNVKYVDTPVYYYRVTKESLSRTATADRVLKRIDFVDVLLKKDKSELANNTNEALEFSIVQNVLRIIVAAGRNMQDYSEISDCITAFVKKEDVKLIISHARNERLSNGKFQNLAYEMILFLLKKQLYYLAFRIGIMYCKVKHKD